MELTISPRARERKKEVKRLRRAGIIPAVVYQGGEAAEAISVQGSEFASHLRQIPKGGLSTTIFELKGEKGSVRALVKDIHYNITSYDVIHLDFQELKEDTEVTVRVPIRLVGSAECVGVKLGGVLRPVIRAVSVRCLPGKIPAQLEIAVSELGIGQTRRLRDIAVPEGVRMLDKPEEVAVVVAKR